MKLSRNSHCYALAAALLTLVNSASAEVLGVQNINDFTALGYVPMGRLSASLIYPALTGKPYDAKLVVYKNRADFPRSYNAKMNELNSSDEFTAHAALNAFQPLLDAKIEEIKSAKGYVVPLNVHVGEYDFAAHRFPLSIQMITDDPKSSKTYTCGWEFNRVGKLNLGACVGAKNWTKNDAAFQYLSMNEAQGQELKNRFKAGTLAFYFLMEPVGRFQIVTDPKLRYRSDQMFTAINVSGLQEANVLEFIIADRASGDILIAGPMPGARISNSAPAAAPVVAAPVATLASAVPPLGASVPADTAPAVATIKAGMPSDAASFELDKFLSQVAYAVYSDAQLIDDSNANLQKAQKQLALIENDPRRDEAMRAKEARDARAKIDALSQKLAEQQAQGDIKENVGQTFGARRLSYPSIEAFAASKRIYFDSYATSDAKRVIVFRGTANKDDVLTDLKLGMTPELFSELARRTKASGGSPMLSGVSDLAVKNMAAGPFNANDAGMPEEFRAAEDIVARLMATGVRASDIVLSGHSLGGGYAQYAGMRKRVGQVVAFNPAPLSAALQKEALAGLGGSPIRMRHYISFVGMQGNDAGYFDPVSQLTSEYLKQPGMNALRVIGEQYVVRVCASTRGPDYQAFEQKAQDFINQKTNMGADREGSKFQTAGKVLGAWAGALATKDLPKAWLILNAHKMKNLQESMQQGGKVSCAV